MDPLALEALRFGVAILAGGIVAVISSVLAFRYARRLQDRDHRRRDDAIRRALVAEIRENMQRLGGPAPAGMPGVPIVRGAWDDARSLPLPVEAFNAVARAYAAGEEVSRSVELVTERAVSKGIVASPEEEGRPHEEAVRFVKRDAGKAFAAFRAALEALGEPVIQIGAPLVRREPEGEREARS